MAEQAQAVRAALAGPVSASQVAAAFTAWGPEPALLLSLALGAGMAASISASCWTRSSRTSTPGSQ